MKTTQVIAGTLRPDGTLELRDRLSLPPGLVRITVESLATPAAPSGDLVGVMNTIRQAQAARGYGGRLPGESRAEEEAGTDEDAESEARWRAIHAQTTNPLPGEAER